MSRSVGEFTLVGHLGEGSFATVRERTLSCSADDTIRRCSAGGMTPLLFSAYCSTGVTGYAYAPVCCYRPPPRRSSSCDVQCSLVLVSGGSMSLVFVKQGRNAAVLVAVGVCLWVASGITKTVQICSWRRARVLMRCVPRWPLGCRVGSVRLCHGGLCVVVGRENVGEKQARVLTYWVSSTQRQHLCVCICVGDRYAAQ